MRVIAGLARGHILFSPKDFNVRPTADKIRESLFNILAPIIRGAEFLDLFSGTGAVGIEALSRGAARAVFVDCSSSDLIKKNLAKTRLESAANVIARDYAEALNGLRKSYSQFDIIYIDPPYNKGLAADAAAKINKFGLLRPGGIIIAEQSNDEARPAPDGFIMYDARNYGASALTFYRRKKSEAFIPMEEGKKVIY